MSDKLFNYPNVVGHGTGYKIKRGVDTRVLSRVVLVSRKLPLVALSPLEVIPPMIQGRVTDVIQVGHIRAHEIIRTGRFRPAPGGVSVGHYKITAGTLGAVVHIEGQRAILSNNHVLANSNDANIGDSIHQPGPLDGGGEIALLHDYAAIVFDKSPPTCKYAKSFVKAINWLSRDLGSDHRIEAFTVRDDEYTNIMDAAVAFPSQQEDLEEEILKIGFIQGVADYSLGLEVVKSGRTTGVTRGTIIVIGTTISVSYGSGRTAKFENQIVTTAMSQPGDSGSLLLSDTHREAVGLLFAGSDQATIHSPIRPILQYFGATIVI